VPALVSESPFALAQEQLERNKHHSPRRTVEPSLLQGMLVCEKCGYALYRSSAQTSKQKLYYYRCLGSDAYRYRNGAVCDKVEAPSFGKLSRWLGEKALGHNFASARFGSGEIRDRAAELRYLCAFLLGHLPGRRTMRSSTLAQ